MAEDLTRASKFLSLLLRHDPGAVGLALDASGWARIDDLERLTAGSIEPLTRALVERVVATSDKKRFALSEDGACVRANQGHSVAVDLGLVGREPPERLYHGTAKASVAAIRAQGLVPGSRQHVHLSVDETTARKVGARHGSPVVLVVRARELHATGHAFFLSDNGVWLTASVPPAWIEP